ncbi:MAG: GTPase [Dehalococcoidales bacterium]
MPANLTPQYYSAEKVFKQARTTQDKIAALEEMLAVMPKHKGTDHLKADLRRRIARLTQSTDKKAATQRASLIIQKEGAAQVLVLGLPNAGKSQLIARLTNASVTVADYPFTTHTATPGMMEFENIQIQLVDTPPLEPGSNQPWLVPNLIRADALLVMIDLSEEPLSQMETITAELGRLRTGIGRRQADREPEDALNQKLTLIIGNKIDLAEAGLNYKNLEEFYQDEVPVIAISARKGTGLEEMKLKIFEMLDIIRVYTKTPSQKPDMADPLVLRRGSTLEDAAREVHKDFQAKLKFARIWGSGKHDGVMIKRDHILQDGDIIELHM